MPELPDLTIYIEQLEKRIRGERLEQIRLVSPFFLRSVSPPPSQATQKRVIGLRRIGKRIVIELEGALFLAIHLMISGRLQWKAAGAKASGRGILAAFDFPTGTLIVTEAGTKRRASLHLLDGAAQLALLDAGGLEVLGSDLGEFAARLRKENHTLKRALTDPRLFGGIGNAYSDEILHAARLSPLQLTSRLQDDEVSELHQRCQEVLRTWTDRLREETGDEFPRKVTAFRDEMAVHGRYGKPCPVCGTTVQRIIYAENECNYCPRCQTGGKVLADRGLSRLLKEDWPRTIEEMEARGKQEE